MNSVTYFGDCSCQDILFATTYSFCSIFSCAASHERSDLSGHYGVCLSVCLLVCVCVYPT